MVNVMHSQGVTIPMFLLIVNLSNEADISYFCLLATSVLFFKECV